LAFQRLADIDLRARGQVILLRRDGHVGVPIGSPIRFRLFP
jgi:hypothetical protein